MEGNKIAHFVRSLGVSKKKPGRIYKLKRIETYFLCVGHACLRSFYITIFDIDW